MNTDIKKYQNLFIVQLIKLLLILDLNNFFRIRLTFIFFNLKIHV